MAAISDFVVTIPLPSYEPRQRGVWARTEDTFGVAIQTKCHRNERTLIDEAANELGVSRSAFMRWCAVHVAQELKKRKEKGKDNGTRDDAESRASLA